MSESAKEICIKQYHAELARKQIDFDLPRRMAGLIGVEPDDLTDEVFSILISIGRGIYWAEPFHLMAKALANAVEKDIETETRRWVD